MSSHVHVFVSVPSRAVTVEAMNASGMNIILLEVIPHLDVPVNTAAVCAAVIGVALRPLNLVYRKFVWIKYLLKIHNLI
jgi:hypothetical protein